MTIAAALQAANIDYTDWSVPGYGTPERPTTGGHTNLTFTPEGILVHHTGGTYTSANYVANIGRVTVPPPLYSVLVYRSGEVHLITEGRSNNAGAGYLSQLITLWDDLPPDLSITGAIGSGNQWWFGVSMQGRGSTYTPEQIATTKRVGAAICVEYGWSGDRNYGHKEWAGYRGKIDPELDMTVWRNEVKGLMEMGRLEQELTDEQITFLIESVQAETDPTGFALSPTSKGHTVELLRAIAAEAGVSATDEDALADWIAGTGTDTPLALTPAGLIALMADPAVQASVRGIVGESILNG